MTKDENERRSKISINEILAEMSRRLIPSIIGLINPQLNLVTSVIIFLTWVVYRKYREIEMQCEYIYNLPIEARLVKLDNAISKLELQIKALEDAAKSASPSRKLILENDINNLRKMLERLIEIRKLEGLKYSALIVLSKYGNKDLVKEVRKIMEKIDRGEELDADVAKMLYRLEELRRNNILTEEILKEIIDTV